MDITRDFTDELLNNGCWCISAIIEVIFSLATSIPLHHCQSRYASFDDKIEMSETLIYETYKSHEIVAFWLWL